MTAHGSVIDLFAGPGGWDLGARALGLDPVGLELDDAACATRRAAGLRTMQCDVAAVGFDSGWLDGGRRYGLIASPPCQSFSAAGKGKGRADIEAIQHVALGLAAGEDLSATLGAHAGDPRSMLVVEPLRWVLALRPEWTCWEQVPPVLAFWEFCAPLLRTVGYDVWTGHLQAEAYGVPQTRRRAFLIASRTRPAVPPAPTHSRYYPRDPGRLDPGVMPWVSMAEALGWGMTERPSMTVCAGGTKTGGAEIFGNGARQGMRREMERGAWVLQGNNSVEGVGRAQRDIEHPALTVGTRADLWTFRRPATTVNCDPRISKPGRHDPNISGSQQAGAIRVTAQEAAVLQSFPADHPWQGTKTKQFEQIGNAVPPLLAMHPLSAATGIAIPTREEAADAA